MTEEQKDNGLEDLFRSKLEENEMVAGSDLEGRVMRRLERREFFRFNISRFNFYYLTAAVTALTVAGVMIFSDPGDEKGPSATGVQQETVTGVTGEAVIAGEGEIAIDDSVQASVAPLTETAAATTSAGVSFDRQPDREPALTFGPPAAETVKVSTIASSGITAASPAALPEIESSVVSGCVPLHVSFACNAEEGHKILWNFGDGGTSSLRNPDYIYDIPGAYTVTLTVTDRKGLSSSAGIVIEVHGRPEAAFEVRKNDPWNEGDRVEFVNLSTEAVDYLWDFGDGIFSTLKDPSHRYADMGTYNVRLVAWSAEGCADSVTVSDLFTDRGMYMRFPNAFVPNEGGPTGGYYNTRTDEESSVFHPVAAGIEDYNLKIYSKAGMLVFESTETELGWDGYHKGDLCAPGVYVWKVRGTYRNGQKFIMAGDVTLLKY